MSILDEVNHRPESRMREIRTSGSEGGGIEPNRSSLPLSCSRRFETVSHGRAYGLSARWASSTTYDDRDTEPIFFIHRAHPPATPSAFRGGSASSVSSRAIC